MAIVIERASQRWWSLVVRGVLVILFGVLAIVIPPVAVWGLVLLFGIYSLADGLAALAMLYRVNGRGRWLFGLMGVLSIAAGLIAFLWPGITAIALFYVIAWWAILMGLLELIGATSYSYAIENEWAVVVSGLLWIGFGVMLLIWPLAGVVAVLSLIATFAILRGIMLIVGGVRLRQLQARM